MFSYETIQSQVMPLSSGIPQGFVYAPPGEAGLFLLVGVLLCAWGLVLLAGTEPA